MISMLETVVLLIFVLYYYYFSQDSLISWTDFFLIELCIIINVFTATFDQFIASLL